LLASAVAGNRSMLALAARDSRLPLTNARCAHATFTLTFDFTDVSRSQTSTAPSR
jgi:hypothetical protein